MSAGLLLDTHVFLWVVMGSRQLKTPMRRMKAYFSSASVSIGNLPAGSTTMKATLDRRQPERTRAGDRFGLGAGDGSRRVRNHDHAGISGAMVGRHGRVVDPADAQVTAARPGRV